MIFKTFAACVIVSATVTALAGQQSVMDTILADTTLTGTSSENLLSRGLPKHF